MDKKRVFELRGKAQMLKPTVYVGREGVTASVVHELTNQVKKNKLVKVKILPAVESDLQEIADDLARASSSELIEIRGRTAVFAKE
jgi:RNA-binding protein